jgi:parallel beta-helix repeat protein
MLRRLGRTSARFGIAATLAALFAALLPTAAQAITLPCGASVTTDVTLTADMNCTGTALRINASNITVDLGGHTVSGPKAQDANRFTGVAISPGRSGDIVRNGTIRGFNFGLTISAGANDHLVTGLTFDGNDLGVAIFSGGSPKPVRSRLIGNHFRNTSRFSAMQIGGNGHAIQGNDITNAASTGIFLFGNDNLVSGNTMVDTGAQGILINTVPNEPGPFIRNQLLSNRVSGGGRAFSASQISVHNAVGTLVRGNVVAGRNSTPGIFLENDAESTVDGNVATSNGEGILVRGDTSRTTLANNVTDENNFGISVQAPASNTVVDGNEASHNTADGINVGAPSTTLENNAAYFNGRWGIAATPGVTDGGGNRAAGNGVPAQCTSNIHCT